LLHLYYKSSLSKQISDITKAFEFSKTLDISKVDTLDHADVYLVEIQKIEKTLLLHIRKLLSNKTGSLIYFFVDEAPNLMLFQLAFFLGVKNILTPRNETLKVISDIKRDTLLKKIALQSVQTEQTSIDFIKTRIYFIERLKEKLLKENLSKNIYSIITINIENMDTLCNFWSEYEIEMAIRDLLLQVELDIDAHTLLAQYSHRLYITLFEGLDFEATKQKAYTIQKRLLEYSSKEEVKPIIGLHVFDVNDFELNDALKIISDIAKEKISSKDIEIQKIYRVINIDSELDDEKAIDLLLQSTFTNKSSIKLLNIYKGLCINTSAMIVKKTQEEIYVNFQQLQGTVMNFEKGTVIQSANFTKDIEADVKLIDLKKRVALLKNFRFVDGSAIGRKYSRVTSSQRTPISIINAKGSLSGDILDISMNSIAIKTRLFKQSDELKSTNVTLKFTLPIKNSQDGYMALTLEAKVTFIRCSEEFCKIVVDLEEDQAHESILMEYVYDRQKELIVELKKQTIMRN